MMDGTNRGRALLRKEKVILVVLKHVNKAFVVCIQRYTLSAVQSTAINMHINTEEDI